MSLTETPIGELNKRIIFLKPTYATGMNRPSTNEDEVTIWTEVIEVWGKVAPFSGDEAMIAERLTDTHHVAIEVNYRVIESDWRFVIDQRVYAVVDVLPSMNRIRTKAKGLLLDNETWT